MSTIRKAFLGTSILVLFMISSYVTFNRNTAPVMNHPAPRHHLGKKRLSLSQDQCRQILPCLTSGKWSLKEGVRQEDIEKRIRMDKWNLDYQGFPSTSARSDGRCGKGEPLCDAYSPQPCCNENQGRCGNTSEYCTCKTCTDFRNYLPAEIAQWKPNNDQCKIKNFSHSEACTFFQENISEMLFIGDSLVRHFFVAFALLLTGDNEMGGLNIKKDLKRRQQCKGEMQFFDAGKYLCHNLIAHQWEELPTVCGGKANFTVSLEESYSLALFPNAKKAMTRLLNKTGSVVVFGVGIHMGLNSKQVIDKYVGPIVDMVTRSSNGWPKLIWQNLHGIDNYLRSDSNEIFSQWRRYNAEMNPYLKSKGVSIFDTERLTNGIKSYDGRHFGLGGNMIKVQVLMNYLDKWFKMCQKYEVRK